jgi:capsular polysaccharide transport system permease protein
MGLLGLGGGALMATATERWEPAERFVQPSQYLMVPLSGCFFLTDWVPPWAQHLLLLNPMVHSYEVVRAGFFGDLHTFHYDFGYFFACAFVLVFLGLFFVARIKPWIRIS